MKKILILSFFCATISFAQQFVPGKLTVILREQALQGMIRNANGTATLPNATSLNALGQQHGLLNMRPMSPKPNSAFRKFFEFQFPTNANLQALKTAFENNPLVEWVNPIPADNPQPLGPYYPNDAKFSNDQMWYVHQGTNTADVNGPEAWEWTLGSSNVVIAICGGGIKVLTNPSHSDYSADVAANLWSSPNNPNVHGWNFYDNTSDIEYTNNPFGDPLWWHGTPMASEAASAIDNCTASNCGVGVAPNCKIMGVPHYDYRSIIYAADNGAKVFVYAFTFDTTFFAQFITYAYNAGMLFVNAAGNLPGTFIYQSSYGVSVSALDSTNKPPSAPGCSTTGSLVKLSAPALYCGSSYAAPVAGGVAALMRSFNSHISLADLRWIFINAASCNTVPYSGTGAGRIDAFKALKNVAATATLTSIDPDIDEHPVISWSHNYFALH